MSETMVNNEFLDFVRKGTVVNRNNSECIDITGITLDEYHVDKKLQISSGEADIYLCSNINSPNNPSESDFIMKYYRRTDAIKPEVIEKLQMIRNPCVAPILKYGIYEDHQYVILPYYRNPTLADILSSGKKFSEEHIKKIIIPSVIEGLQALHKVGILHKDLKPSNLIPDNTGEHIVLIDFGISSDAGKNTFVVTHTGMTLVYAAPEALQGLFHRETDYYALGITVFELFTGYTPFQNSGLTDQEMARMSTINTIEFPDNFPRDLKNLVLGLTYKDLSHRNEPDNPNRRWGYSEVKQWLNGVVLPIPGSAITITENISNFLPYNFGGTKYSNETALIEAMFRNPYNGMKDLGRGKLTQHYGYFDARKEKLCQKAEKSNSKDNRLNFLSFSKLLYQLSPETKSIFCNGKKFASLEELGKFCITESINIAKQGTSLSENNTSPFLKDFIFSFDSGIFEEYAANVLKSDVLQSLILNIKKLFKNEQNNYSIIQKVLVFGYSVSEDRHFIVNGRIFDTPADFKKQILHLAESDYTNYKKFITPAINDLKFLFNIFPDNFSKSCIKAIIDKASSVKNIILNNGFFFGNYLQNGRTKTPIEWIILEKNDTSMLIISKYALDCIRYHRGGNTTWEQCDLRKWLNNDFLNNAFTREEQSRICLSHLKNETNPNYGTKGGNDTDDRIFCLSISEARQYFRSDNARKCQATAYAAEKGSHIANGFCYWWLRSPGRSLNRITRVRTGGDLGLIGHDVSGVHGSIRPALRIKL